MAGLTESEARSFIDWTVGKWLEWPGKFKEKNIFLQFIFRSGAKMDANLVSIVMTR